MSELASWGCIRCCVCEVTRLVTSMASLWFMFCIREWYLFVWSFGCHTINIWHISKIEFPQCSRELCCLKFVPNVFHYCALKGGTEAGPQSHGLDSVCQEWKRSYWTQGAPHWSYWGRTAETQQERGLLDLHTRWVCRGLYSWRKLHGTSLCEVCPFDLAICVDRLMTQRGVCVTFSTFNFSVVSPGNC